MLERLPDLSSPVPQSGAHVFRVFDRIGEAVALPHRLLLDRQPGGEPALRVTLVRGSGSPTATGGRLSIGLTADADLATAAGDRSMRLLGPQAEGGMLELTGPEEFRVVIAGGPEILARAAFDAELGPIAAVLAHKLTESGRPPVTATLRLLIRAVAPRLPLVYEVDSAALVSTLASWLPGAFTIDRLAEVIEQFGPIAGDPAGTDPVQRRHTLALRLLTRIAVSERSSEPLYRLRADAPVGKARIDLSVPTAVPIDVISSLDTVAAAAMIKAYGADRLVHRADLPTLPTGRIAISLRASLVQPVGGVNLVLADLRLPPRPPWRPQPVSASAELAEPDRAAMVTVALAPDERIDGQVRLRAVVDTGSGPEELTGPWRPATSVDLVLGSESFPVPLTVVRLTSGLSRLATVEARSASGRVLAVLDSARPAAAIPADGRVVVRALDGGGEISIQLDGRPRLDLDPATLPGFGTHEVTFAFPGASAAVLLIWRPEGTPESAARTLRLGPGPTTAQVRWQATSAFQPGLLWRTDGAWSAPVTPADGSVIDVPPPGPGAEVVEVDGIELRADRGAPGRWTYVLPGPFVERTASGKPDLSIVESGTFAFLQLTTRLDLPEADRVSLLAGLREHVGESATEVRALPVVVQAVELRTLVGGEWIKVAGGRSSGLPPWTTALSASLTPAQHEALKQAVGGTQDRAVLYARFDATPNTVERVTDLADQLGAN